LISRGIGDISIYPARACLFSGKPGEKFQSTQFLKSGALVLLIVGSSSGKPGETGKGGGGAKKIKK